MQVYTCVKKQQIVAICQNLFIVLDRSVNF